ncbi:nuclear transport factor 2 family protein [Nocardioides sp. KIGAM211]|uniref:Nuclear transport factor 2 family protein n=1 Tax=Nocardioides luti TaxID=2761101 RepID=A0A7X0RFH7_9ACTN|nr:nuclear transport factor 2 family protein [Nocardioides luti]MBB6627257.1 nuclear transport factor 2 family protein [Nocardioides luti]
MGDLEIAVEAVARLQRCLRERDVEGAVACFVEDGATYGADLGEHAHGHEELRDFMGLLFKLPVTVGWEFETIYARRSGDILWFVAPAQAVVTSSDGTVESLEFRLSGVLRDTPDGWLFELFNGTEPVVTDVVSW